MYATILIFSVAIVFATSAPVNENAQAQILSYKFTNDGSGNYEFSYETSNGLRREETGEVVYVGREDEHIVVRGIYSYIDADGKPQIVQYSADKKGYETTPFTRFHSKEPGPGIMARQPFEVVASLLGG
ncbi:endocuticle structural glycoprotein SgAbd-5-like [Hyposmocoma kahamanoa]|uniref:endocuticle structural glycoprotein SgAbd-5-like n=1 Tax=Hyposmocoma kahamanoa TaxID=1477025 RepID=UPI000E6DA228|nr:endocuticle structural glycoprotein SgAbd-5-like [Hyposmocoma kahamanoa]